MIFVMANVREMDGAEKQREGDRFFDLGGVWHAVLGMIG